MLILVWLAAARGLTRDVSTPQGDAHSNWCSPTKGEAREASLASRTVSGSKRSPGAQERGYGISA